MIIASFTAQYRFLSNFFVEPDQTCVEVEHQAAKCLYLDDYNLIIRVGNDPRRAKRIGKTVALIPNWDELKVGMMYRLVYKKFYQHKYLAKRLIETGTNELIEGNHWGDDFWGVCTNAGQNHMGKILMDIRSKLT